MSCHPQPAPPLPITMLARVVIGICEQQQVKLLSRKGEEIEATILLLYEGGITSETELLQCARRLWRARA